MVQEHGGWDQRALCVARRDWTKGIFWGSFQRASFSNDARCSCHRYTNVCVILRFVFYLLYCKRFGTILYIKKYYVHLCWPKLYIEMFCMKITNLWRFKTGFWVIYDVDICSRLSLTTRNIVKCRIVGIPQSFSFNNKINTL